MNAQKETKPKEEEVGDDACYDSGVERHNVLGVGISVLSLDLAVETLFRGVEQGELGYVTVTGVHGVVESQSDNELRKIHNRSFLSTPDGMPMVWLGKWRGHDEMTRVYGPDLMLRVIDEGRGRGAKHYFFGGGDGVVEKLKGCLSSQYEGLEVVGLYTPPFRPLTEGEELELLDHLLEEKPHFVWVGLSTPKQERFMHGFLKKYGEKLKNLDHGVIFLGVGAAFDFHAGLVSQAPSLVQKIGMEWFYRLCMEPRRLWKRYTVNNSKFIFKIIPQMMGLKKYKLEK